jgi:beta-glucosidase
VTVTVDIKNNGGVEGKAVAQIYVNAPHASHWEAPQRLAGWAKVHLKPGQSTQATIKIDPRLLATFNAVSKKWEIAAGDYKVRVGDSATSVSGSVHLHLAAKSFSARHSQ